VVAESLSVVVVFLTFYRFLPKIHAVALRRLGMGKSTDGLQTTECRQGSYHTKLFLSPRVHVSHRLYTKLRIEYRDLRLLGMSRAAICPSPWR